MSKGTAMRKAENFSWGTEMGSELSCLHSLTTEIVKNILHFPCVNSRETHHCFLQWPLTSSSLVKQML